MNRIAILFVLLNSMTLLLSQPVPSVLYFTIDQVTRNESLETNIGLYKIIEFFKARKYIKVSVENSDNAQEILVANDYTDIETNFIQRATKQADQLSLYISNQYYGISSMSSFYIQIKCAGKCSYKLILKYYNSIELSFDKPFAFYSHSMMTNNEFSFPHNQTDKFVIVYAISGSFSQITSFEISYPNPLSTQQKVKTHVSFYNGWSGTFAQVNYDYASGINFKVLITTLPFAFTTIGVREMNTVSIINPNQSVIYGGFSEPLMSVDCFKINSAYTANAEDAFVLNMIPYSQNLELTIDNNEPIEVVLPSHLNYSFQQLKDNKICIKPSQDRMAYFSFQLINMERIEEYQSSYEPLTNGVIYNHYLKDEKVVYYQKRRYAEEDEISSMTLKVLKGNPKMYKVECTTYPNCSYTKETIKQLENEQKLIVSHKVNDYYTIVYPNKELIPISPIKHLQVVYCEGNEDCEYYVTAFNQRDKVRIYPLDSFCLFQFKSRQSNFQFHITDPKIMKLIIYVYALSGSVNLKIEQYPNQETEPVEFFLGSRITVEFIPDSIEGDEGNTLVASYDITVTTAMNSYFLLMFIPSYEERSKVIEVNSGIAMLEYIKRDEYSKLFKLSNKKVSQLKSYLTSILSMNCLIKVSFYDIELQNINDLVQHEITPDMPIYTAAEYFYIVDIVSMHSRSNTCMLYVSGLELDDNSQLVVSEANPIIIQFNKNVQRMSYLYPHPSIPGNVIINFNFDKTAKVKVKLQVESGDFKTYTFANDRKIIILEDTIEDKCKNTFLCNILISIELVNPAEINEALQVQMLAKSKSNVPSFLKNNVLREDVIALTGIQYYYVQVGVNENGEILIDFTRGNGRIYARIVETTAIEADADWNGRVKLPTTDTADLIQYDPYTLKITYTQKETAKCGNGCEIYIGVESTDKYSIMNNYLFEYTIFSSIKTQVGASVIAIKVDDYITGSLSNTIDNNYYDFYSLIIPNETNKIIIDFQSEIGEIYLLYGTGYPSKNNYDYKFTTNTNTIFTILKESLPGQPTEIKGKTITLAIGSETLDEIYHAYYLFKITTPEVGLPELIRIISDMNYLCEIRSDNSYCDFVIPLHDYDEVSSLLLYVTKSSLSHLSIYVNVVSAIDFDINYSSEEIMNAIPREGNALYTSADQLERSYLFIESNELTTDCYVLVSVLSTQITDITFQSTFRSHIKETIINPNSKQLYHLEPNETIDFTLPHNNNYLIRVDRIIGKGIAGFKGERLLTLKENFDSISITSNESNSIFIVKAEEENFGFVISYEIRPVEENFDEVYYSKTTGIVYRSTDFPILFYVRIDDESENISLNMEFKRLFKEKAANGAGELSEETFQILGVITSMDIILKKKRNKDVNPLVKQIVQGDYDQVVQTGKIYFKSEDIKAFQSNTPKYLFVSIAKTETNRNRYSFIHSVITIFPFSNIELIVKPNKYHFFNMIEKQNTPNIYQLRRESEDENIMQIEFSSGSKQMTFAILKYSDNITDTYRNATEFKVLDSECQYGKTRVVIDLKDFDAVLLSIFPRNNQHIVKSEIDSNYIFRYKTKDHINKFKRYTLQNNGVIPFEYEMTDHTNTTFRMKINCLPTLWNNKTNVPGRYILRVYPLSEYDTDSDPNALSLLIKKPLRLYLNETEGTLLSIEMTLDNLIVERKMAFSIIAIIKDDSSMFSFQTIMDPLQSSQDEPIIDKSNFWLIIYISSGCIGLLLLILFIGFWKCCSLKRRLKEEMEMKYEASNAKPILEDDDKLKNSKEMISESKHSNLPINDNSGSMNDGNKIQKEKENFGPGFRMLPFK